ncbi:gamma-glutamyltransferase [Halopseudomonas pachastrellae]|nr:gamma-glutamyltransferase [Halopseudomonas pachastrellae]
MRQPGNTDQPYRFIDARETAPGKAGRDLYRDASGEVQRDPAINGPLAAGIPGIPAALVHLAEHYGRLPLAQSLAPAIEAAENGFNSSEHYRTWSATGWPPCSATPKPRGCFLRDNQAPEAGTLITQPDLANTLRAIASNGRDGFYRGPVAEQLLRGVQAAGGVWQQQDLDNYRVIERSPIRFSSGGYQVISAPLPSAGGIALAGILQALPALPASPNRSIEQTHQLVRADAPRLPRPRHAAGRQRFCIGTGGRSDLQGLRRGYGAGHQP